MRGQSARTSDENRTREVDRMQCAKRMTKMKRRRKRHTGSRTESERKNRCGGKMRVGMRPARRPCSQIKIETRENSDHTDEGREGAMHGEYM
jgi:hypothetical protein